MEYMLCYVVFIWYSTYNEKHPCLHLSEPTCLCISNILFYSFLLYSVHAAGHLPILWSRRPKSVGLSAGKVLENPF